MMGLTLKRPWDYAILHGKPVENRPQRPPKSVIGVPIGLHAGLAYDYDAVDFIKRTLGLEGPIPDTEPGAIFAVTTIVGCIERGTKECLRRGADGVEGLANDAAHVPLLKSPWFFGPIGYVLENTRALKKPIHARGMQGFWPVPTHIERRVLEQLGAAE